MNRITRKMIHDALRARGREESLRQGDGYFYFGGGEAVNWLSASVMAKRLSDLTLEAVARRIEKLLDQETRLREPMDKEQPILKRKRSKGG